MRCEMCGKEEQLFKSNVEDVEMNVCKTCSGFGQRVKEVQVEKPTKTFVRETREAKEAPELIELLVEGFGLLIKQKREKLGLKQNELAIKMAVKESWIQNVESGKFEPRIALAKKMERFLGIKLVEQVKEEGFKSDKKEGYGLTLGDMVQIKRK